MNNAKVSETVTRGCCIKHEFFKISQNLRKNTCGDIPLLIKVADWRLDALNFIKNTLQHSYFPVNFA